MSAVANFPAAQDRPVRLHRPPVSAGEGACCPLLPCGLMAKRLASGRFIRSDAGLEKWCGGCREYWPFDTEFWYPKSAGRHADLHTWCKACYLEHTGRLAGHSTRVRSRASPRAAP